jgi:hypothetical protein
MMTCHRHSRLTESWDPRAFSFEMPSPMTMPTLGETQFQLGRSAGRLAA